MSELKKFIEEKMSMSAIYQPLIIRELLFHDGVCSVTHLAKKLAENDFSTVDYYKKIVKRWPRKTLSKHEIIEYNSKHQSFHLLPKPKDDSEKQEAISLCDEKIYEWLINQKQQGEPDANPSLRYKILKNAGGRCELCGISSDISPIDIDHIVPRSRSRKGKVKKGGKYISLNAEENLQALCARCNRAKRDNDQTDFRRTKN